jgi:uncharacterized membrane protein HdeD (DUF308 family)
MDTLLIVAKVLGVYLIVSGLFLIFRGKTVPHLMKDFFDHPAIMYLAGAILIFLTVPLLLQYNIWDGTWRTIVTIFIWAVFVKGVAYILAPEMLQRMMTKKLMGSLNLFGIVAVIGGAYLFLAV